MTKVVIEIEGATPLELTRGAKAIEKFWAEKGVSPWDGAAGAFAREGWDVSGFNDLMEPTARELELARWWDEALEVGARASGARGNTAVRVDNMRLIGRPAGSAEFAELQRTRHAAYEEWSAKEWDRLEQEAKGRAVLRPVR